MCLGSPEQFKDDNLRGLLGEETCEAVQLDRTYLGKKRSKLSDEWIDLETLVCNLFPVFIWKLGS